jgi:tetratricopeptide (TPR) repeat protein
MPASEIAQNNMNARTSVCRRVRWTPYTIAALILFAEAGFAHADASAQKAGIPARLESAQRALAAGDFSAAEREFHAILALDPANTSALANLGVVGFFRGDWAGAADRFRQVLKTQPRQYRSKAMLGLCERRLGNVPAAKLLLRQSVPHLEDGAMRTQAGLELIEMLYQDRELYEAASVVHQLQGVSSTNPDLLYASYRVFADLAYEARDALAMAAPDSARMHQMMAEYLVNLGDLPGALVQYRKALEIDPRLRGVHYELGQAILLDSTSETALREAEKHFRQALAEDPANASAYSRLGQIAALRLDFQAAITYYTRALSLRPGDAEAHVGLGEALLVTNKQPGKAIEHYRAAIRLDPLNAKARYRLAALYREAGRPEEAQKETAACRKLLDAELKLQDIYRQMRQLVPEKHRVPADLPK